MLIFKASRFQFLEDWCNTIFICHEGWNDNYRHRKWKFILIVGYFFRFICWTFFLLLIYSLWRNYLRFHLFLRGFFFLCCFLLSFILVFLFFVCWIHLISCFLLFHFPIFFLNFIEFFSPHLFTMLLLSVFPAFLALSTFLSLFFSF